MKKENIENKETCNENICNQVENELDEVLEEKSCKMEFEDCKEKMEVLEENKEDFVQKEEKVEEDVKENENFQKKDSLKEFTEKLKAADDKFLRLSAEFANYKRRTEQEKADISNFASEDIIKKILPIIDDFDRAMSFIKEKDSTIQGIDMIINKLKTVLKNEGLEEIDALGKELDPNFHYAVFMEESDEYPSQSVCEVVQKGYMLKNKVIRPAMVKVVK